jgi:8-oxo-dGTP pyrophosphatase MutT (NUDIX family)
MSSKPSKRPKPSRSTRRASKTAASKAPRAEAREFSAGGVVVRDTQGGTPEGAQAGGEVVVIVPTRRAADGSRVLALPKGHVDPGEIPIEAATREVREETGIVAEPVCELGESRYWYRRDGRTIGKSVVFYLFSYVEGDTADHDDEVEEVRWIGLQQARTALSHAAEREMVELALARLDKDR